MNTPMTDKEKIDYLLSKIREWQGKIALDVVEMKTHSQRNESARRLIEDMNRASCLGSTIPF